MLDSHYPKYQPASLMSQGWKTNLYQPLHLARPYQYYFVTGQEGQTSGCQLQPSLQEYLQSEQSEPHCLTRPYPKRLSTWDQSPHYSQLLFVIAVDDLQLHFLAPNRPVLALPPKVRI